jgi:NADH dehydrogenase FAD-containing subunit
MCIIRHNILLTLQRAENERDPVLQARLMAIVLVGGGPTRADE